MQLLFTNACMCAMLDRGHSSLCRDRVRSFVCSGVEAGGGVERSVSSCVDDKTAKKGGLLHLVCLRSCQCTLNSHLRQLQLDCVHKS